MRNVAAGLLLLAASTILATASQAQSVTVRAPVAKGYCEVLSSNPADAELLKIWENTYAVNERLLRGAVECRHVGEMRKRPMTLLEFTQSVVVQTKSFDSFSPAVRRQMASIACDTMRKSTGANQEADIKKRLSTAVAGFRKVGDEAMIGIAHQDANACHVVVAARAQSIDGQPITIVHVRATAAIKDQVLHFYATAHVLNGNEGAALDRIAAIARTDVEAAIAANP